jgi:tRNA(fMet)-specific endonuclease VapC
VTFALDTNTVIYFLKGIGRVQDRLLLTAPSNIAIPSIVLYELEVGISQSTQPTKRRSQLDALLSAVEVLPLDIDAAKSAAELSGVLNRAGTPIGPLDTLIAGIVLSRGATLVTHNIGEFRRVRGLRLEDWY